VEPEKQPLLANGSETTFVLGNGRETDNGTTSVARQQIINKQEWTLLGNGSVNTDMHATEELCFLRGPCRDVISKGQS
jgi:hypothetical protein